MINIIDKCMCDMLTNSTLRKHSLHILVLVIFLITHKYIQYIPRNMHTVFALLCFVVVIP